MLDIDGLTRAVLKGDRDAVRALTTSALGAGEDAQAILNRGLLPAMDVVGQRFGDKQIFINEVLLSARAMHVGLGLLRPVLARSRARSGPRRLMVIGTVKGDLHDIGKNLVAMMLEGAGLDVVDVGANAGTDLFVQAIKDHRPSIVGMSALLTTTMRQMKVTLEDLRQRGVLDGVKTIIGGAPVTQEFADAIGADGYAPDATAAVAKVRRLLDLA
jgi:5-methyltetrahydrofolate--homocysteine methyltransferase